MGVPGLWDILRPTGRVRALTHVAVEDGFVANQHGHRAYRIGIDASIWFFHALGGREGENPELRTLFFRCARLLAMPYLPIFVFDGPGRPKIKRGKVIGGKEHWLVNNLRTVLDAFGFECRTAPGEAEAELAFLNRVGVIDAILSDDVDCFIFGARTVMRNGSVTLSGNRGHATGDAQHVYVYRAEDIAAHPSVSLSQGGLILIALLRGGDYDEDGITGCGVSTAHALARAGFGDRLLAAAHAGRGALAAFLPAWRADLRQELRTNASGFAPRKCPSIAQRITDDFPSLEVLRCYAEPLTSERRGADLAAHGLGGLWANSMDVGKIAHVCERFFEWGVEEVVVKRFRTVIWPGAVLRTLLQHALERDNPPRNASSAHCGGPETPSKALARSLGGIALGDNETDQNSSDMSGTEHGDGTDAGSLIKTIHSTRRHASTDNMLEYRVEVRPRALVARTREGIQGLRVVNEDSAKDPGSGDEDGDDDDDSEKVGARAPDPDSTLRVWMPGPVVEYACPRLVKEFEARNAKKAAKKSAKGLGKTRKPKATEGLEGDENNGTEQTKAKKTTRANLKGNVKQPMALQEDDRNKAKMTAMESMTAKGRQAPEGKAKDGTANDLPLSRIKEPLGQTLSKAANSKSLVELLDEDPFLVSAGLSPMRQMNRPKPVACEKAPSPPKPRPFPLSLDINDDIDAFSSGSRTRSAPTSTSDPDSPSRRTTKSPRKSVDHASPQDRMHKASPPRAPSPSPMRPLQRARMKPLQKERPVVSRVSEDVIVISSDSDAPDAAIMARPRAQKPTRVPVFSEHPNLNYEVDIIDLT